MMGDNGRLLIGDEGFMLGNRIYPESRRGEFNEVAKSIPRCANHYGEWIASCKGEKPAGSSFGFAGPLAEAVLLGNVALRVELRDKLVRHRLEWDPVKLQFSNVPEANKFLKRDYREGWSL
jgi:hypothetical protein